MNHHTFKLETFPGDIFKLILTSCLSVVVSSLTVTALSVTGLSRVVIARLSGVSVLSVSSLSSVTSLTGICLAGLFWVSIAPRIVAGVVCWLFGVGISWWHTRLRLGAATTAATTTFASLPFDPLQTHIRTAGQVFSDFLFTVSHASAQCYH